MEENDYRIRPMLRDMAVGEEVAFPLERLRSVRAMASELGLISGRRYTTRTDRGGRRVTVTRLE